MSIDTDVTLENVRKMAKAYRAGSELFESFRESLEKLLEKADLGISALKSEFGRVEFDFAGKRLRVTIEGYMREVEGASSIVRMFEKQDRWCDQSEWQEVSRIFVDSQGNVREDAEQEKSMFQLHESRPTLMVLMDPYIKPDVFNA